jgi:hypothetical protein
MNTSQPIAGETFASGVFASEIEVSSTDEVLPRRRHSATLRGAGFARVPLKRSFFLAKNSLRGTWSGLRAQGWQRFDPPSRRPKDPRRRGGGGRPENALNRRAERRGGRAFAGSGLF